MLAFGFVSLPVFFLGAQVLAFFVRGGWSSTMLIKSVFFRFLLLVTAPPLTPAWLRENRRKMIKCKGVTVQQSLSVTIHTREYTIMNETVSASVVSASESHHPGPSMSPANEHAWVMSGTGAKATRGSRHHGVFLSAKAAFWLPSQPTPLAAPQQQ